MHKRTVIQQLDQFRPSLDRGKSKGVEAAWQLISWAVFQTSLPWPSGVKVWILRRFGATVGRGVVIRPRTMIHLPWKLEIGDYTWIGFDTMILNLEQIEIGSHCSISHRAFLCTGNHDYKTQTFDYTGSPIHIEDGVWVGSQAFVGPGVTLGRGCVITAGAVATADQPAGMVCGGNPCSVIRERGLRDGT